jgi:hypothetical protein
MFHGGALLVHSEARVGPDRGLEAETGSPYEFDNVQNMYTVEAGDA